MPAATRPAAATDVDTLAAVLARAFRTDPLLSWMFGDADRQEIRAASAFELWLRRIYLPKGAVDTDVDRRAAALWTPPGRWQLTATQRLRLLPSMARCFGPGRLPAVLRALGQLDAQHPDPPHWYLGLLGTDPDHQGQGRASSLLAGRLSACDRHGRAAYLEASAAANVPFYEQHGFRATGEIALDGGPTVWPMWRDPA